jgi:hypothetical protein
VDLVHYRGYLVHLRRDTFSWRFMAAPSAPDFPIVSRAVSRLFNSKEQALAEAKQQIDRLLTI